MSDVRNDPIGSVNSLICWVFSGRRPKWLRRCVSMVFHVELPILHSAVRLPHPYGIVINGNVTLGRNVTVFQDVTIGSKRSGRRAGAPVIEDDVCIFPNSVVVGRVTVGAGATIGPCSVVIDDVPAGAVVAGNPACQVSARSQIQ